MAFSTTIAQRGLGEGDFTWDLIIGWAKLTCTLGGGDSSNVDTCSDEVMSRGKMIAIGGGVLLLFLMMKK